MSLVGKLQSMFKDIHIILLPIFGSMFIVCSGIYCLQGELSWNGQRISYATEPSEFIEVIFEGMSIGLVCILCGVVGYVNRRRQKSSQSRRQKLSA